MAQSAASLRLFGSIELRGEDVADGERLLAQPKVVGLLALLSVPAGDRFLRRDSLVGLLWPELDQAHARAALRKAVLAIRRALGPGAIMSRGDEEIALAAGVLTCDASEFIAAAEAGSLLRAADLYRGELLPGFHLGGCGEFERWLDEERKAARERASAAAWALAQQLEAEKDLTLAANWARKAARLSADDERVLRRALLMLERLGDRAGAARLFEEFAQRLRSELEVEPSAETLAVVAAIRGRGQAPRA